MTRNIVICDDSLDDIRRTKDILEEYDKSIGVHCIIHVYTDGNTLLDDLKYGKICPDVIFMDIELQEVNGIHIAKEINTVNQQTFIVYLTNYIQYAVDAYRTEHIYYVLKKQLKDRLPEVYEKIHRQSEDEQKVVRIELKGRQFVTIKNCRIFYLERKGRSTIIHTKDGQYESPTTINEMEAILDNDIFVRCHNSYIVSMQAVTKYIREEIILGSDERIPISRRFQPVVRKQFIKFAKNKL